MKKGLLFISVFLIGISIISVYYFYSVSQAAVRQMQETAVEHIRANSDVTSVVSTDFYHGTHAYQVIRVLNGAEEEVIFWVREDLEEVVSRKAKDGLSKEDVKFFIQEELQPVQVKNIRLGIENGVPIYEITYTDQDGRFSYYYMTFKDGTFVKRYSIRKS